MKKNHLLLPLFIAAIASALWLAVRGAETVTETTKATTLKTTRSMVSIVIYPVAVMSGGVSVSTNIGSVEINYVEKSVDSDGVVVRESNGATVLTRDQVWASTNTTWRTGMTNAWDGQLDMLPSRIVALWKRPDYILPPTP